MAANPSVEYYSFNLCLICNQTSDPEGLSKLPSFSSMSKDRNSSAPVDTSLWAIYLLRHVINYPKDKCVHLFEQTFGVLDPGGWFTLCRSCLEMVNDAYRLEKQVAKAKRKLRNLMFTSTLAEKISEYSAPLKNENEPKNIQLFNGRQHIRNFFKASITLQVGPPNPNTQSCHNAPSKGDMRENTKPSGVLNIRQHLNSTADISSVKHELNVELRSDDLQHQTEDYEYDSASATMASEGSSESDSSEDDDDDFKPWQRKRGFPVKYTLPNAAKRPKFHFKSSNHRLLMGYKLKKKSTHFLQSKRTVKLTTKEQKLLTSSKNRNVDLDLIARMKLTMSSMTHRKEKLICNDCDPPNPYSLFHFRDHVLLHLSKYSKFTCKICRFPSKSKDLWHRHMRHRHKDACTQLGIPARKVIINKNREKLACPKCPREYGKNELNRHLAAHEKFAETSCPKCNYPSPSSRKLEHHLKYNHLVKCDLCPRLLRTTQLKPHAQDHETYKNTTCNICQHMCKSESAFQKHLAHKTHLRKEAKMERKRKLLGCKCEFQPTNTAEMRLHKKTHLMEGIEISQDEYRCKVCSKTFKKEQTALIHVGTFHRPEMGLKCFSCDFCTRKFSKESSFKNHVRVFHEKGVLEFCCDQCGKKMGSKASLMCHIKRAHATDATKDETDIFICDSCGMETTNELNLQRHISRYHSGAAHGKDNPFEKTCRLCDAPCVNRLALHSHMKAVHSELYKFKCHLCDAKYTKSNHLAGHIETIHNSKMVDCERCGATVKHTYLKVHLRKGCKGFQTVLPN